MRAEGYFTGGGRRNKISRYILSGKFLAAIQQRLLLFGKRIFHFFASVRRVYYRLSSALVAQQNIPSLPLSIAQGASSTTGPDQLTPSISRESEDDALGGQTTIACAV